MTTDFSGWRYYLEDEVDHGAAGGDCRAAQRLKLAVQVDDAVVDGVLDDGQLLADGVYEVRGQLGAQEASAHVFEV